MEGRRPGGDDERKETRIKKERMVKEVREVCEGKETRRRRRMSCLQPSAFVFKDASRPDFSGDASGRD